MKFVQIIFMVAAMAACQPKQETAFNTYGETIITSDAADLASLKDQLQGKDSIIVTLKGTIEKTCAKKGCWMSVQDKNGSVTRITFKDYGFFVPIEGADGKEVVFSGVAKRKVTDVATLRHFAEDDKKSQEEIDAIVTPKEEIEFVANGVVIYEKEANK